MAFRRKWRFRLWKEKLIIQTSNRRTTDICWQDDKRFLTKSCCFTYAIGFNSFFGYLLQTQNVKRLSLTFWKQWISTPLDCTICLPEIHHEMKIIMIYGLVIDTMIMEDDVEDHFLKNSPGFLVLLAIQWPWRSANLWMHSGHGMFTARNGGIGTGCFPPPQNNMLKVCCFRCFFFVDAKVMVSCENPAEWNLWYTIDIIWETDCYKHT